MIEGRMFVYKGKKKTVGAVENGRWKRKGGVGRLILIVDKTIVVIQLSYL